MKKAFDGDLEKGEDPGGPDDRPSLSEKAFRYLFSLQNSDGGWGAARGDASTIAMTAMALISLRQCPETPRKRISANKAVAYLLAGRREDGGFGDRVSTVKDTALVYNALHGMPGQSDTLDKARDFIASSQLNNGSWNDDLYVTILAMDASSLFGPGREDEAARPSAAEDDKARNEVNEAPPPVSGRQRVKGGEGAPPAETPAPTKRAARERSQPTKISLVSRRKASASTASEPPAAAAIRDVAIQSVNTDRKKYPPNETVHIYSTIDNKSDLDRSIVVSAQIADPSGYIAGTASHDTGPSVNLSPGAFEPVAMSWHTGMYPAGAYSVRLSVADAAEGHILDEKKINFSITPAIVIEEVSISATPAYCSANEEGSIALTMSLKNRSNTNAPLKADVVLKDPDGNTVHRESVKFELPVSAPDTVMELGSILYNFKKCGQYSIEAAVRSGNTLFSQARTAVHVNPPVRIDATRSLDPSIVTPDGDKAVRVGIRLEGVGITANPSIVHARTNTVGDAIYITCDKAMADPTGNESRFAVTVDGSPVVIKDLSLDIPDITTLKLMLEDAVSEGAQIYISLSSEDLVCVDGRPLIPFVNELVANRVSPPVFNQDGFGFSGAIAPKPLTERVFMTGYGQWPTGFRKGNQAFTGAVFDGGHIWMVPANAHSVVKVDRNTGEMTAYGQWPEGFRKGNQAFSGGVFDGRYVWLIPGNAEGLIRIDITNGAMTSYNAWPQGFTKGEQAFAGGVFDGRSIFMVPSYADSVVKIDTISGDMTAYNNWPEGFAKGGHAFSGGAFDGRSVFMIPANADSVIAFDTVTAEMKRYNEWPEGHAMVEYAFSGGVFDGRSLWMVPYYSEQVVRMDTSNGRMTGHHPRPAEMGKTEYAFSGGAFDGRSLWMVPLNADRVVRIDKDTGEVFELHDWPQGFHKGVNAFTGGVFDGDCIWMIPSYADRVVKICSYSSMSVTANITSNDLFSLYVSQDESEEGTLVGKGQGWASIQSINACLVPGVTNYLHVKCVDTKGPVPAFIADLTLNDPNFHFADGTQKIVTSEDHWWSYLDRFGGTPGAVVSIGKNGLGSWSTLFGIDLEANWIWTHRGADKATRYFSTPVYYSPFPVKPMEDVRVTTSIGGPDVMVDQASFTREPARLEKNGDTITVEWDLKSLRVGQKEDTLFNVTVLGPRPGEERVISDSLHITYTDAGGVAIHREFGPCHVHVLPSSFISSIDLNDDVFTAGDNVSIGCSFKNVSNSEKTARLTASIEDADGSIIQQASRRGINFPPGVDKRIDGIVLNLTSAFPGYHRARVVLSDGEEDLAEAIAEFFVEHDFLKSPDAVPPAGAPVKQGGVEKAGPAAVLNKDAPVDIGLTILLDATIMAQPSPIYQGLPETVYYKISPVDGADITAVLVEVAILTMDGREKKQTLTPPVVFAEDGSCSGTFSFSTGNLAPGQYLACLMATFDRAARPEEIASTQFAVRRIDVVMT